MCYSALVCQDLRQLGVQLRARVDHQLIQRYLERRRRGEPIGFGKAFEHNFSAPATDVERACWSEIEAYRGAERAAAERELFSARKRLAGAERKLASKPTKAAQKERDMAARKIARARARISRLSSPELRPADSRVQPLDFAPVIVSEGGERMVRPMRYMLRPRGEPEWFDARFQGCHDARRDSLTGFWKDVFGRRHGVLVIESFFENVKQHDFERRELRPGEEWKDRVLEFRARGFERMLIPCLWDEWTSPGQPSLHSFAVITDEPPAEVAETGHDRCPIFLKEASVDRWLNPEGQTEAELMALLDDRERPIYEHRLIESA